MATNNVNLGIGLATGMAYFAPIDTALPAFPGDTLSQDWVEIGAVSEDGVTFNGNRDFESLRNWAKEIERSMPPEGDATLEVPFLYTNSTTLELLFSEDAVTTTAATSEHGNVVSVNIDPTLMPEGKAFLFLMKDGDDLMMIGTSKGFVTSVSDIAFSPTEAIVWTATISAKNWTFAKNDGQTV